MAVLLDGGYLRLDTERLDDPANDHLIFSKGHASPLFYSVLKAAGDRRRRGVRARSASSARGWRATRRRASRRPTWRPARSARACRSRSASRSAGKRLDRLPYRVWCLCGDSEMAEGSMWEAFEHAAFAGLDNLTAIIDVNRLGQTRETMVGWDLDTLRAPRRGVRLARDRDRRPRRRRDRRGLRRGDRHHRQADGDHRPDEEGQGRRGRRGPARQARQAARRSRRGDRGARRRARPDASRSRDARAPASRTAFAAAGGELPTWEVGEQEATRKAYGEALTALGGDARRRRRPRRRGLELDALRALPRGAPGPLLRDVHRRAADGRGGRRHAGARLGARSPRRSRRSSRAPTTSSAWRRSRGRTSASPARTPASRSARTGRRRWRSRTSPSFRAIHGSTVLHPSDANQTAKLVAAMADREGISFLRTLRGKTEVRTPADEDVAIGGSRVVARRRRRRDRGLRRSRSTRPSRRPSGSRPTASRRA